MIKPNKYRLFYFLVSASLVLLFSFLVFWNYNQYKSELSDLERHVQLVFENSIRELEEGMWQTEVMEHHEGDKKYLKLDKPLKFMAHKKLSEISNITTNDNGDTTIRINTTIEHLDGGKLERDTSFSHSDNWVFKIDNYAKRDFTGMMSLHLINGDEYDSLRIELLDSVIFDNVMNRLRNLEKGNVRIVKISDLINETEDVEAIHTGKYVDIVTGEAYKAELSGYKWEIIAGMWPQIAFSTFLFCITGLAFFYIIGSLKNQERLAVLKNDFISNMTHELKTPITTVGVALEALSNFKALEDPVKSEEYLKISQKELNRLTILVDKVLKMALFEKEEPELKVEMIDIKQLITEVADSMKLHFEKFKGKYTLKIHGEDFNLEGDKIHLTSVIYNLLDNALKYSPRNPKIDVDLYNHPASVILSVKDNGIGIDPAYHEKIFEKFFRIPTGDAHNVKGYGLGLAYVNGVVKKHHGTIRFESEKGKGTTFIIDLPRKYNAG